MNTSNTDTLANQERETTNNFLIVGIIVAFIVVLLGILIYAYVSNTTPAQTNNSDIIQDNFNNDNSDDIDTDDNVISSPSSYLI